MFSNQLIHETSPYLLQHAHNPVNWYPWGDEALRRAREEDKPILVSIGYAACHWCHVMERESFEDESTAALMNDWFINIKIDREERPDLDHIYMDAVQAMTGSGGWPLNVFLTPDTRPFYGGTYFPPARAYNRASWKEVLTSVHTAYLEKKHELVAQADNLTEHLLASNSFGLQPNAGTEIFQQGSFNTIANNILANGDREWGGFGKAPKFPQTFCIQYLLRHYHFTKDSASLDQALLSLDKMIDGGIYDQLGGGFARYSTDTEWLAPHFEKMLYDNALLVSAMADAYQLTHNEKYSRVIRETIGFIQREMTSPEQGFYSALDADSEGVEGKFYTWQKAEIDAVLGDSASLFCAFYDVSDSGNWEHVNILRVLVSEEAFAAAQGMTVEALRGLLASCRGMLLQVRATRMRPQLDDKILLGWNAMMVTAYARAYAALGDESYRTQAVDTMHFLRQRFEAADGAWHHTYKNGQAKVPAFLDDYACLIQALIHLQEITGQGEYLRQAEALTEFVIAGFQEVESGFFFFTHRQQQDVIIRKKEVYDGATPSGNAVMVFNLLYLAVVFDRPEWRSLAERLLSSLGNAIVKHPTSFAVWAQNLQLVVYGWREIAITGQRAAAFLRPVLERFIPNKILQADETSLPDFPLFRGKKRGTDVDKAFYLCKDYTCLEPVSEPGLLLAIV